MQDINGPEPKKSLGQHWLHDDAALDAMLQAAGVNSDDVVLEVGPGLGTLTKKLVQSAKSVVAVEFDETLANQLAQRVKAENLSIHQQDILKFDLTSLPVSYKVVANIPYYLTSNLIRVLSETTRPPLCAVLLVQQEVAERAAAKPGAMSLLSVTAQYYWEVGLARIVEAALFTPPPKVDSQILRLIYRKSRLLPVAEEQQLFQLVKAGFSSRRKTLHNSLAGGLRISKAETAVLLERAGITPTDRPQTLSVEQWVALYRVWQTVKS